MNKYLMMTAAAVLGSASPALAADQSKTHTIHFLTASGGSYCDGMSFQKSRAPNAPAIATGLHLNEDCAGKVGQMIGTVNKTAFHLSENYSSSVAYMYDIFKPIRNGGTWDLWICYSGTTCFEGGGGIYKLGFPASGGSHTPTTARVAEIIAQRKAMRR